MNSALTEKQQALINAVESLPEDMQDAVKWLTANYDTAAAICKAKALTEAERSQLMNQAERDNNMVLLVLALLERIVNA